MTDHYFDSLMGTKGGVVVASGDGNVTGAYYGIYFITDAQLGSVACNLNGASHLTGRVFGAGVYISAVVSQVSVTGTGLVLLMND